MNSSSSFYVIVITLVILLSLSAFFSLCEMSFSALNRIKLKNLAAKSKRAAMALKMLDKFDKLLSTVLIGTNIVNIASSALATFLFVQLFGASGVSVAAAIMTVVIFLFTEISPKALAKEAPELTAFRVAPLLRFFIFIFTPLSYFAGVWKKLIVKIFPVKADRSVTEDELLTFIEEVRQEGGINRQEEQMIRQAIEFDDRKVSSVFTPRVDVSAVAHDSGIEEIDQEFIETGFSRLPVFQGSIDNITGVILFKDFYREVMRGRKTPAQIIKPVVFVTKTIKIAKLLKTLQEKKTHLAVVVDEHGGTLGIVTIEDIIEELVGEIWDENDKVVEPVKKNGDGSFTALGSVNFADMLEAVAGENARNIDEVPDTTVANWVMETLGRLPHTDEKLTWNSLTFRVLRVFHNRVMEVRVNIN